MIHWNADASTYVGSRSDETIKLYFRKHSGAVVRAERVALKVAEIKTGGTLGSSMDCSELPFQGVAGSITALPDI
jgi:hypothetical protein